jgi:hypothetical protein
VAVLNVSLVSDTSIVVVADVGAAGTGDVLITSSTGSTPIAFLRMTLVAMNGETLLREALLEKNFYHQLVWKASATNTRLKGGPGVWLGVGKGRREVGKRKGSP